ncbi:hypothetical protein FQR65_LT18245 [Abscondita terminalis]|nr:hypothetical protein FQR65_LT18245 [Abscondita terminalis]
MFFNECIEEINVLEVELNKEDELINYETVIINVIETELKVNKETNIDMNLMKNENEKYTNEYEREQEEKFARLWRKLFYRNINENQYDENIIEIETNINMNMPEEDEEIEGKKKQEVNEELIISIDTP